MSSFIMSYAYDVILSYFHYVILSLCCHVILSSCHLPWCGICDLLILPAPSPNASQPWSLSVFQLAHLRACELVSNSQSTGVGIILSSQFTGMDHFEFTIQPSLQSNPVERVSFSLKYDSPFQLVPGQGSKYPRCMPWFNTMHLVEDWTR